MFFFRADSNPEISAGHIMRCLAIATSLIEQGNKVRFLIADNYPVSMLEGANVPYINLHSDWQDLMTDVEQVKQILTKENAPVLLIDTYRVTRAYVDVLKPYATVGYLGSKPEYLGTLDFLINYSTDINYEFYQSNYGDDTTLLLGPSYAPLRKEFQNNNPRFRNQVKRILLTTGNTDNDRITEEILGKAIPILRENNIVVDVVIGRMFDNRDSLKNVYGQDPNVVLHENVSSMSSLMKDCDLAISANGTTVYELSAIGIPTISFALVEEQVKSAEALSRLGTIEYCGKTYEGKDVCVEIIIEKVSYFIENDKERIELAQKAHKLIDGNGCQKIVKVLRQTAKIRKETNL